MGRYPLGGFRFGERINAVVEISAEAPDGPRVGINGLGLQALQLQVPEMGFILLGEMCRKIDRHAGLTSRNIAKSVPSQRRNRHAG